jgi:hypothetical protein
MEDMRKAEQFLGEQIEKLNNLKKYKVTPLKMAVHRDGVNAVFGESVIHVSVDDLAGGGFIKVQQGEHEIDFEIEDLEQVLVVAKQLLDAYKRNGNEE